MKATCLANILSISLTFALAALLASQPARARQSAAPPAQEQHVFHVTVTDTKGNLIKGLPRDSLTASDGGKPCDVVSALEADSPASVMFLLDTSSSAFGENTRSIGRRRFAALKDAVAAFIEGSNPSDEYSLAAFNETTRVLLEGSGDARDVLDTLDRLASSNLKGHTAFYDALHLALDKLAARTARKRVVIVFSDGMNNSSRHTYAEVRRAVKESGALVYTVGVFVEDEESLRQVGRATLRDLAELSGGAAFYPDDEAQMKAALTRIAAELRAQYEVTVAATARAKGDGWHEVKFKLAEVRGAGGRKIKTTLRARKGFYDAGATRKH